MNHHHPGEIYFYWLIGISAFFYALEWLMPWRKTQKPIKRDFWLDVFYMFFNFFLFSLIGFYAVSNMFVELFNGFLATCLWHKKFRCHLPRFLIRVRTIGHSFCTEGFYSLEHPSPIAPGTFSLGVSQSPSFSQRAGFYHPPTVPLDGECSLPNPGVHSARHDRFWHSGFLFYSHDYHLHWPASTAPTSDIPLGVLKYLFNNPQMHIDGTMLKRSRRHILTGINFGISLSIWDYVFKTAYVPHDGEAIRIPGYHCAIDQSARTFYRTGSFSFLQRNEKLKPECTLLD